MFSPSLRHPQLVIALSFRKSVSGTSFYKLSSQGAFPNNVCSGMKVFTNEVGWLTLLDAIFSYENLGYIKFKS